MSAFMCSDRHLSVLAQYAVANDLSGLVMDHRTSVEGLKRKVFNILAKANGDSLDARYPQDKGQPLGSYSDPGNRWPLVEIIKACHCYAYQACETTTWEDSQAKQIVDRIEAHAVRHLPGYAEAPWGL